MVKNSTFLSKFMWSVALVLLLLVIAGGAFGQTEPKFAGVPTDDKAPIKTPDDVTNFINGVLYWISIIFWIAAVGFVFYAAYLYLTAAGSDEQVKKAKKQLLYAVIAIAIGLMAQGLPAFVKAFLEIRG